MTPLINLCLQQLPLQRKKLRCRHPRGSQHVTWRRTHTLASGGGRAAEGQGEAEHQAAEALLQQAQQGPLQLRPLRPLVLRGTRESKGRTIKRSHSKTDAGGVLKKWKGFSSSHLGQQSEQH